MNIYESIKNNLITESSGRVALLSRLYSYYPDISEEDEDFLNSLSEEDLISEIKNRGWNDVLDDEYEVPTNKDKTKNALYIREYDPTRFICVEKLGDKFVVSRYDYEFVLPGDESQPFTTYLMTPMGSDFVNDIERAHQFDTLDDAKASVDNVKIGSTLLDSEEGLTEIDKQRNIINSYPSWIREALEEYGQADFYYCSDCKEYFKEPPIQRTDMEAFYGVGSEFPDSHYQDLLMCPACGGGVSEESISLDSIIETILDDQASAELLYEKFPPELINSDTIIEEDYPDETRQLIKDLLFN